MESTCGENVVIRLFILLTTSAIGMFYPIKEIKSAFFKFERNFIRIVVTMTDGVLSKRFSLDITVVIYGYHKSNKM